MVRFRKKHKMEYINHRFVYITIEQLNKSTRGETLEGELY